MCSSKRDPTAALYEPYFNSLSCLTNSNHHPHKELFGQTTATTFGIIHLVRTHEGGGGKQKRTIAYKGEGADTLKCVRKKCTCLVCNLYPEILSFAK